MNIDAGPGDDNIHRHGADRIRRRRQRHAHGAGGDRIVGDRGDDTLNGGAGDDTLVWTNGDGNDVMNGDAGFDVIENDLGGADDSSTLKVENGRVRYDRINAPFNLSIGSAELMQLNTFGGNDTLTTTPDVALNLVVNGGSGNDTLNGASGNDRLDGGDGDDVLNTRDGKADFAVGGAGTDKAFVDSIDAVAADVESVDRPPAAPRRRLRPRAPLKLPKTAKVKKGVASIKRLLPGRHRGLQRLRRAVLGQDDQGRQAQGQARARPQVLRRRRRREQDDQGQARPRHGQAGQEEEAGRHARASARRRRS